MAQPIQRIERQMWSGLLSRAVCFAFFWAARACGVEGVGMKRVPGPRRVVVSFQFGGVEVLGELVVSVVGRFRDF